MSINSNLPLKEVLNVITFSEYVQQPIKVMTCAVESDYYFFGWMLIFVVANRLPL